MENNKIAKAVNYYFDNPVAFAEDICKFYPTAQQKQVLNIIPQAIIDKKNIATKSGHGTGKTAIEAIIVLWFIWTRPNPKIIVTAPTQHQLFDVSWSELAKWHKKSLIFDLFDWKKTSLSNTQYPEQWFVVARTSNKAENMQGFHAENLLFMVDEASGVDYEILEAIEGSQTQEGSMIMMFGNPTQLSGGFFDAFNTKRKFYYTFTFNSEESENVSDKWCEGISLKYGKDSDIYRVRVLGEFPTSEPDTLIPLDRVEKACMREMEREDTDKYNIVEIGADIARFGDDETSIYSRVKNHIKEEKILRKRDLMTVVGAIVQVAHQYKGKDIIINVDDTGLGGGVTDRLNELVDSGRLKAKINGVNNGSKAKDSDEYINCGTEMWFFMREKIQELSIPDDNDLIGQLSSRKYKITSTGKNQLEPKDKMKERGLASPDRADAVILTCRSLIYADDDIDDLWGYAC